MSVTSILTRIYPSQVGMAPRPRSEGQKGESPPKPAQPGPGPISPPISPSQIEPKDLRQASPKIDVAQEYLEPTKQTNPKPMDAYLGSASLEEMKGDYDKALEIHKEALGIDPASCKANFHKGQILFYQGRYAEAKELFTKAKESALRNISQHENDIDSHMILGMIYQVEGDYRAAIEQFETVCRLKPANVENISRLGNVYEELGNFKKALAIYQKAAAAGSKDISLWMSLWMGIARVKYAMGGKENFREAFDIYNSLRKFAPPSATATPREISTFYYRHASISYSEGKYEEAIQYLTKALELNPKSIETLELLADSYLKLSRYDEALSTTDKILKLEPANQGARAIKMDCYFSLAVSHGENGAMSQSEQFRRELLEDLKSAEKLFPRNLGILKALKNIYWAGGEYEEAARYLEKIINLIPADLGDTSRLQRESKNIDMYLSITNRINFSFDGKEVKFSKLERFQPRSSDMTYTIGEEFQNFIESSVGEVGYYYIDDENNLRKWIENYLNHGVDLSILSAKEAIMLAAELTELVITYSDKTALADLPHVSVEEKISDGNGVCRNYVPLFMALFNTIKSVNLNLKNIYVGLIINSNHTWNVVFEIREDSIIAVPIDLTFDDDDDIFGNNLEALDDDHFNRFDQAENHIADPQTAISKYEEAIKRFITTGAEWIDTALLKQVELYFVQGKYEEAKAKLNSILKNYPRTERLAEVYHLLGIVELRQGNLTAAIEYLKKEAANIYNIQPGTRITFTLVDEKNNLVLPEGAKIEMEIVEENGQRIIKTENSITPEQIKQLRKSDKLQGISFKLAP